MYDRKKLVITLNAPQEFAISEPRPVTYRGLEYNPVFKNGSAYRYETKIENLLLHIYPRKALLLNSLHKFWHGVNWTDFYLTEFEEAISLISDTTGINWGGATIKELEYGCNIEANSDKLISSLLTYKHKDYFPMVSQGGKKYGVACAFDDYRIKGYDKQFELKTRDRINLTHPLFRWEIQAEQTYLTRLLKYPPLVKDLMKPEVTNILANDAVTKFVNSIKMQKINLSKLTCHEKLVLAAMRDPEIRDDLKIHNQEVSKKYRKMYTGIMTDPEICIIGKTGEEIARKLGELITGIPVYSMSGKRGMSVLNRDKNKDITSTKQLIIKNSNTQTQELSTMTVNTDQLIIPNEITISLPRRSGNSGYTKHKLSKKHRHELDSHRKKKLIFKAAYTIV